MEEWDQAQLEAAIAQKHGAENKNNPTAIICKFFLNAVEGRQYGWCVAIVRMHHACTPQDCAVSCSNSRRVWRNTMLSTVGICRQCCTVQFCMGPQYGRHHAHTILCDTCRTGHVSMAGCAACRHDKGSHSSTAPHFDQPAPHFDQPHVKSARRRHQRRFWKCPNGSECKYRHALPPGYILKSQMKELLEEAAANVKDAAEIIEEERAKLDAKTPITEEVREIEDCLFCCGGVKKRRSAPRWTPCQVPQVARHQAEGEAQQR